MWPCIYKSGSITWNNSFRQQSIDNLQNKINCMIMLLFWLKALRIASRICDGSPCLSTVKQHCIISNKKSHSTAKSLHSSVVAKSRACKHHLQTITHYYDLTLSLGLSSEFALCAPVVVILAFFWRIPCRIVFPEEGIESDGGGDGGGQGGGGFGAMWVQSFASPAAEAAEDYFSSTDKDPWVSSLFSQSISHTHPAGIHTCVPWQYFMKYSPLGCVFSGNTREAYMFCASVIVSLSLSSHWDASKRLMSAVSLTLFQLPASKEFRQLCEIDFPLNSELQDCWLSTSSTRSIRMKFT